jgi:hypothetical protein
VSKKRNSWMGDKETVISSVTLSSEVPVSIHVMHRRHKNPRTGKIRHSGWIHFNRSGAGTIDGVPKLRRLARAILKSIGDIP